MERQLEIKPVLKILIEKVAKIEKANSVVNQKTLLNPAKNKTLEYLANKKEALITAVKQGTTIELLKIKSSPENYEKQKNEFLKNLSPLYQHKNRIPGLKLEEIGFLNNLLENPFTPIPSISKKELHQSLSDAIDRLLKREETNVILPTEKILLIKIRAFLPKQNFTREKSVVNWFVSLQPTNKEDQKIETKEDKPQEEFEYILPSGKVLKGKEAQLLQILPKNPTDNIGILTPDLIILLLNHDTRLKRQYLNRHIHNMEKILKEEKGLQIVRVTPNPGERFRGAQSSYYLQINQPSEQNVQGFIHTQPEPQAKPETIIKDVLPQSIEPVIDSNAKFAIEAVRDLGQERYTYSDVMTYFGINPNSGSKKTKRSFSPQEVAFMIYQKRTGDTNFSQFKNLYNQSY